MAAGHFADRLHRWLFYRPGTYTVADDGGTGAGAGQGTGHFGRHLLQLGSGVRNDPLLRQPQTGTHRRRSVLVLRRNLLACYLILWIYCAENEGQNVSRDSSLLRQLEQSVQLRRHE